LLAAGVALAAAVAAVVLALVWKGDSGNRAEVRAQPSCDGPWSECSAGARWLRQVLARTGYEKVGPGTGSALVIPAGRTNQQFFWAVRGVGRPHPAYSAYDKLPRVGVTSIYGDEVRLLWQAQGWNVYLEPPSDPTLLAKLVRLTRAVPAPPSGP
jgi:hypothetical protein